MILSIYAVGRTTGQWGGSPLNYRVFFRIIDTSW